MTLDKSVVRYSRMSELRDLLIADASREKRRKIYMLPSRSSEDEMIELLRTEGSWFGERPKVWSWNDLYKAVVKRETLRRQVDPPDHRLILKKVVADAIAEHEERGRIVPVGAKIATFVDLVDSALRELALEGVYPDLLLEDAASDEKRISSRELLQDIYFRYIDYLDDESHRLIDNAMLPTKAVEEMDEEKTDRLLRENCIRWVGLLTLTGAQRRMVRKLAEMSADEWSMRFFVPAAAIREHLDLGRQLGTKEDDLALDAPEIKSYRATDRRSQFCCVASMIKKIIEDDRQRGHDIAIKVSEGRSVAMRAALMSFGIQSQLMSEVSMCATPLVESAIAIYRAASRGWPLVETAHLLARPLLGAVDLDIDLAMKKMPEGEDEWRAVLTGRALDAFDRAAAFAAAIDSSDGLTPRDILEALMAIMPEDAAKMRSIEAGDDAVFDEAVRTYSAMRRETESKIRMLDEMTASLGDAATVRLRGDEAIDHLVSWSSNATIDLPPKLANAVAIYESTPPVLASHEIFFITDVDADHYPGGVADDPLIGAELIERINSEGEDAEDRIHLPTISEKRTQREALFRRLVCIAEKKTVLFRAEKNEEGQDIAPSPFVASLSDHLLEKKKITSPIEEERVIFSQNEVESIERKTLPRIISRRGDKKLEVRISSLDRFVKCPLCWFVDTQVSPKSPSYDPVMESPAERGSAAHGIWELVWRDKLESSRVGSEKTLHHLLVERWHSYIERLYEKYIFFPMSSSSANIMKVIRHNMLDTAVLQDEVELRAKERGITRVGTLFEQVLPSYELENISLVGRADRIDIWGGGLAVIVDYKSGRSGKKIVEMPQTPAYADILNSCDERSKLGISRVVGCCYIFMRDQKIVGAWSDKEIASAYVGSGKYADLGEATLAARDLIEKKIDAEVEVGNFKAVPSQNNCRYCQHDKICRKFEMRGYFEYEYDTSDETADDD